MRKSSPVVSMWRRWLSMRGGRSVTATATRPGHSAALAASRPDRAPAAVSLQARSSKAGCLNGPAADDADAARRCVWPGALGAAPGIAASRQARPFRQSIREASWRSMAVLASLMVRGAARLGRLTSANQGIRGGIEGDVC